jgi:hypothetical protein
MRNLSQFKSSNRQHGYILPLVLLLLIVLLLSSAAFFNRSTNSAQISGQQRDASQTLILAESVLNRVFGRFTSGQYNDDNTTIINDLDEDGSTDTDFMQIYRQIPSASAVPADDSLPDYVYFYGGAGGVVAAKTTTSILQAIADGESSGNGGNVAGQNITATTQLQLRDLFVNATRHPLVFIVRSDPLLNEGVPVLDPNIDTFAAWQNAGAVPGRAAVWVELVVNENNPERLWIFAATVAKIGTTTVYLQRRIQEFQFDRPSVLGIVAPISESGNRF